MGNESFHSLENASREHKTNDLHHPLQSTIDLIKEIILLCRTKNLSTLEYELSHFVQKCTTVYEHSSKRQVQTGYGMSGNSRFNDTWY